MDGSKSNRAVLRAAVTKNANEIESLLSKEPIEFEQIAVIWEILQQKFSKLQVADEQIYTHLLEANASVEDLTKEMEVCDTYLKKYTALRLKWADTQNQRTAAADGRDELEFEASRSIISNCQTGMRSFKLPKIEFKQFGGDVKDWLGFWAQFKKIHEDPNIDAHDKIVYLVQATIPGSRARQLVESFPAMEENYEKVMDCLKTRYGREDLQIEVYVRELLKLILGNSMTPGHMDISALYDRIETQLRSLETLGITKGNCAAILFPLIESCLPESLLRAWQRSPEFSSGHSAEGEESPLQNRLEGLMRFLQSEVENEQRIVLATENFGLLGNTSSSVKLQVPRKNRMQSIEPKTSTAASLVNCEATSRRCIFCEGPHESINCFKAQTYSMDQKKEAIKLKGACFKCLGVGHPARRCRTRLKCIVCSKPHVVIMCAELPANKPAQTETVNQTALSNQTNGTVVLQTLMLTMWHGQKSMKVRAVIDSGSQRSYILASTARHMGFTAIGFENTINSLFGGGVTPVKKRACYDILLGNQERAYRLKVLEYPHICSNIPSVGQGIWTEELKALGIELSDVSGSTAVEVLLGADVAGKLYTGRKHDLQCGLVAMETILGWTLMGQKPSKAIESSVAMTVISLFTKNDQVANLWNLDVLGIVDPGERKTREETALAAKELFEKTIEKDCDGRYVVRLPFLDGHPPIPDYRAVAKRRLDSTMRKLRSQDLVESYGQVFREWEKDRIIERVTELEWEKPCHYLAHRPVIKECGTTKIRPVFDASACEKGKPSLNSCLEIGPNLIEKIPAILLRFRISKIGVVSDIRKAFLQIGLHESDRDFLRFLWIGSTGEEIIYRHRRVVFGINSSPFLLGATIDYHLKECRRRCEDHQLYTEDTIDKLSRSFYVDNCVASVPDEISLARFIQESVAIMHEAKFDLRGWEHSADRTKNDDAVVPVLGLCWMPNRDVLKINSTCIESVDDNMVTKRKMLSMAQKVFDPIGVTCPATLRPKILLQQAWNMKIGWDTEVDEDMAKAFLEWKRDLPYLLKIEIPRWVKGGEGESKDVSLHVFSDASKWAYAAVVFLRVEVEDGVHIFLLAAKVRVAPLKSTTIPRLELLAATIGARLCSSVLENIDVKPETHYWSDSSTVISWIQRTEEWRTFVGNRIKEIRSLTQAESWKHLPGKQNPADLPSRGCSARQLYESKWWEGPAWLKEAPSQWPQNKLQVDEAEVEQERKKRVVTMLLNCSSDNWHLLYFSKFIKTVRMMAWILRFIYKCRQSEQRLHGTLTAEEINNAEEVVWKIVQAGFFEGVSDKRLQTLRPFEVDGLIRLRTKVSNREDVKNYRFPIVLPGKHQLVQNLIYEVHENSLHVGTQGLLGILREKYWVLGGRRSIRSVISKCTVCRRQEAKSFQVESPALPADRVRDASAFEVCGIDFAGPLHLKTGEKVWVCLFTCGVYRAVHLELTLSLSTASFMKALRRFIARRGRPRIVYTDNGTNFVGTENAFASLDWDHIQNFASSQRITWRFNPPTAAWWGGFWERLIGVLKRLLRKVLGSACLSYEDLLTLICECEDTINMRPITYVSNDPKDLIALTPAMFIRDMKDSGVPDCDDVDRASMCRKIRYHQKLREDLRRRFRLEYLGQLKFHKGQKKMRKIAVGEVVLIGNDNQKRFEWPIGRVVELLPGIDGSTRLVRVKTNNGQLLRPVQRLFPLECNEVPKAEGGLSDEVIIEGESEIEDQGESDSKSGEQEAEVLHDTTPNTMIGVTRRGRPVKPPRRYPN